MQSWKGILTLYHDNTRFKPILIVWDIVGLVNSWRWDQRLREEDASVHSRIVGIRGGSHGYGVGNSLVSCTGVG